jgi:mannose-1-phosphate guanylyltransferase
MLASTIERLLPLVPIERILVLTSEALVAHTLAAVPALAINNLIAEPRAAGTAAALTWAAMEIAQKDPTATMICVHADWHVGDSAEFRSSLSAAAELAVSQKSLVTVGIVPSRADPGFGYIQPGAAVPGAGSARRVSRFVEKPNRAKAAQMCADGYLWNSGIFVWQALRFLQEVREHTPELAEAINGHRDKAGFFSLAQPVSVDVGVMERSSGVLVLPGNFGWDDVGTWSALARVLPHDSDGNAARGEVYLVESHDNVVYSPGSRVVLYGVDGLVVVNCSGVTLVTRTELSSDLKILLGALPEDVRNR